MSLFSQLHRTFLLYSQNSAVIADIFDRKSSRKAFIVKRIKGRSTKLLRDQFPQLKEWCPGHLWAPSCYHKTFQKSFIKNASQSVGHGWEVVSGIFRAEGLREGRYRIGDG